MVTIGFHRHNLYNTLSCSVSSSPSLQNTIPLTMETTNGNCSQDELMARLKSQFGDLDLSNLLDSKIGGDVKDADSEESSIAEPSPEELAAWQQSQFAIGQKQLELKKDREIHSVVQRRRAQLRKGWQDDEEGWEQIAPLPNLKNQTSAFFPSCDAQGNEILGTHPLLQKLSQGDLDILGTAWLRLYSSVEGDGLSCFNLLETLRGYPGPTVMLIGAIPSASKAMNSVASDSSSKRSSVRATTIGFYTTSPWVESNQMTGTTESFLFAVNEDQEIHFFRQRKTGQPVMYCHPSTLSLTGRRRAAASCNGKALATTDGLVHGIGVGGSPTQPRLHLTESFEECRALDYCPSFDGGDLLLGAGKDSLNYFDVECIELWAVGGDEWIADSLLARDRQRSILEATHAKSRKVDNAQFLRDFQGGILGSHKLFSHVQHVTDRCDL
jgi:TLD